MSDTARQSDEDLAAAWGAETGAEPAVDSAQAARVLNQAEIDSLLGFDNGPASGEARTGMQKIISSGLVSYERLPMLEIVFDRLVRIMSTRAVSARIGSRSRLQLFVFTSIFTRSRVQTRTGSAPACATSPPTTSKSASTTSSRCGSVTT